jgi:hypothetical protein
VPDARDLLVSALLISNRIRCAWTRYLHQNIHLCSMILNALHQPHVVSLLVLFDLSL